MATLGRPLWGAVRIVEEGEDPAVFGAGDLGMAEIAYECPEGMRFPPFAESGERGLTFARRGIAVATPPEIASALALGVRVRVILGVIVPQDCSVRPFETFVVQMSALRGALKKDGRDTLESKAIKTATNGLYGKHAQGAVQSNAYDPGSGGYRPVPRSPVTCPLIAAFTTGAVRALMFELLNSVAEAEVVVSVSTDGFLTSAMPSQLCFRGPAARLLAEARRRITTAAGGVPGDDAAELLEIKKQAWEVVSMRGRGIATTEAVEGSEPILAKAGMKFSRGEDANALVLERFLDRVPGYAVERWDFISPSNQVEGETDLVKVKRLVRVPFEPDGKRLMVAARMEPIRHGPRAGEVHLAITSVPHETAEAAAVYQAVLDGWVKGKRVLKSMQDWADLQGHMAMHGARRSAGRKGRGPRGSAVGMLVQQLLRAVTHGMWGFSIAGESQAGLARWLTELPAVAALGVPVTANTVKNASREACVATEGCVPAVPAAVELACAIAGRFPEGDVAKFFVPSDRAVVTAALTAGGEE